MIATCAVAMAWSTATTGCATMMHRPPSPADSLRARAALGGLLTDHFRFAHFRYPEVAIWSGEPAVALPDVRSSRDGEDAAFARGFLAQLDRIDVQALTEDEYVSWLSLRWDMDVVARWPAFSWTRLTDVSPPVSVLGGAATLLQSQPLANESDGRLFLALLRQVAPLANDVRAGLAARAERGIRLPSYLVPRIVAHLQALIGPPASSPFGLPAAVAAADSGWRAMLADSVASVIVSRVNPAIDSLARSVAAVFTSGAAGRIGLAQYPGGAAHYAALLRAYSTLDITPEDAHAIGLGEVGRLAAAALVARAGTGLPVDRDSLRAVLSAGPRYAPAGDSSGAEAEDRSPVRLLAAQYQASRSRLDSLFGGGAARLAFGTMDSVSASFGGLAAYDRPTARTGEGRYRLNPALFERRPAITWPALVHQDLMPGGHYQISRQVLNDSRPPSRRLANHQGFVRGWQAYVTGVADSLEGTSDPVIRFGGRLQELSLACGLVIDTGINAFLWTRDDALAFLRSYLPFDDDELEREFIVTAVERPGWLSAATLGARELRGLRRWAEQELGDRFSLSRFHAELLRVGSVPLPVLGSHLERWIWEEATGGPRPTPEHRPLR